MQKFWLVLFATGYLAPAYAQASPTPSDPPSYEQLHTAKRAVRLQSLAELKAQAPGLAGRVVELKGEVVGVLSRAEGRTVLLKIDEAVGTFTAAPELGSNPALRPGIMARLLLSIGEDADATIIAATAKPEPAQPEVTTPFQSSVDPNDIIVVPPTRDIPLPQAPRAATPRPSAQRPLQSTAPAPRRSAPVGVLDIESQKPAYKSLILAHNRKLSPEQVHEIATALLDAAYSNNMDPRFLAAIIAVESDFDIYCRSASGAMGLGQLMPFNLKEAGITDPWNPTQNIHGTARLLRRHLNDYRHLPNGTLLAVAAYNAGPGAVRRAGYQVPAGAQVQRYVWKVYYRYKAFAPDMFK